MTERPTLTTSAGAPIGDSQNMVTAGTAMKFHTEEGNWDIVGNNTSVFFSRDPLRFPDLNHAITTK